MPSYRTPSGPFLHRPICPDGRSARTAECETPCDPKARPLVLAATILASAMAFIDATVVAIALPAVQGDLAASFSTLQWVINAYALMLGGLILIGGAAGDRFGRRRTFLLGIAVFSLASAACALAPTAAALVLARAAQGVGAALLVPQSLAIIASSFPKDVRGRAIGIWAGASAIATALGPPLGGLLIDALNWRAVFWINLPVSLAAVWLTIRFVPESRNRSVSGPLDLRGAGLAIFSFGMMTIGLTLLAESDRATLAAAGLLGLGATGLVAFIRVEARSAAPLMPISLFRAPTFSAANVITLFLYGALSGLLFLLPFDLIERRGLSATEVGLTLLPIGLVIGLLSRSAGKAADRHGPRPFLIVGSLLVMFAAIGFAEASHGYWPGVMAPVVLLAAGMALVVAPLTTAVMNTAGDELAGTASGINNAASRIAGLFAIAILGSVASLIYLGEVDAAGLGRDGLRFGDLPPIEHPDRAILESAFETAYAAAHRTAALWCALAAGVAVVFLRPARPSLDRSRM